MIRQTTFADENTVLSLARSAPCFGPRMEVDWILQRQNSALPYRFLLADDTLLQLTPRGAMLCGTPPNAQEAALFLLHQGITRITSTGWAPLGWKETSFIRMARPPLATPPQWTPPPGFVSFPGAEEIIQVLESSEGRIIPPRVRDAFYAEICLRRNHKYAAIYGIQENQRLVCTAGAYAVNETEAYIACIETRPNYRRKGYAAALIHALRCAYPAHTLTLLCSPLMRSFYEHYGYAQLPGEALLATAPKE